MPGRNLPKNFIKSALIDDADVEFGQAQWVEWDYNGKGPKVLALHLPMSRLDDPTVSSDQYITAGDLKYFRPNKEGNDLVEVGDKDGLSDNSNYARLMTSIMNTERAEEFVAKAEETDRVDLLLSGMQAHVVRRESPKITRDRGVLTGPGATPDDRKPMHYEITEVLRFPWEAEGASAAGRPAKKASKKAEAKEVKAEASVSTNGSPEAYDEELHGIVIAAVAEGPQTKVQLAQAALKALAKDPEKSKKIQRLSTPDFLEGLVGTGQVVWDGSKAEALA